MLADAAAQNPWIGKTFDLVLYTAPLRCQKSSVCNICSCLSAQEQILNEHFLESHSTNLYWFHF